MMVMIVASLMWAGAAEKPDRSKMMLENYQNDFIWDKSPYGASG